MSDTINFAAHAKQRLISTVHPGWWLCTYAENDSEPEWLRAVSVRNYVSTEPGKPPFTIVMCAEPDSKDAWVEVANYSNEYVLCCTKAEAKKAGVKA